MRGQVSGGLLLIGHRHGIEVRDRRSGRGGHLTDLNVGAIVGKRVELQLSLDLFLQLGIQGL